MDDIRLKLCKATWPDATITLEMGCICFHKDMGAIDRFPVEPERPWGEWKQRKMRIGTNKGCGVCWETEDKFCGKTVRICCLGCVVCSGKVCLGCLTNMQTNRLTEEQQCERGLLLSVVGKHGLMKTPTDWMRFISAIDKLAGCDELPCPYCRSSMTGE